MAGIRLDHTGFRYPGAMEDTLAGLDLEIVDGEAHALLGASGAGKTTLLNLLSGILAPTAGRILFDGEDVSRLAGRSRRVAQVFQFPVLYESLSVAENLAFPLRAARESAAAIERRVAYVCEALSIAALREQKPRTLSLFEKQLVAVGKALVRPDLSLVLLDEPLTSVEPKIKWRLRQTLRKVQEELGVTMIYVTHDQTEALTFADRVSLLTDGGILQTGTPGEIYAEPAHEFVGHFVGSPGMNFVPAAALGLGSCDRAGFRPEWANLDEAGQVRGTVTRTRFQGTRAGEPLGVVTLATAHGEIAVRGPTDTAIGTQTAVRVRRYVAFAAQRRVASGEIA